MTAYVIFSMRGLISLLRSSTLLKHALTGRPIRKLVFNTTEGPVIVSTEHIKDIEIHMD